MLLVLGYKDSDMSKTISNYADMNVYIPPKFNKDLINKHPYNILESIGIGVQSSVIISEIMSQIKKDEISK